MRKHSGRNKWHNNELKVALGLDPKAKLPDAHIHVEYQGYSITLLSKDEKHMKARPRGHRIVALCRICYNFIPAGRITQHESRKDHQ